MKFERLDIPDVVLITPKEIGDSRGYFMETFRENLFTSEVGAINFVQDNRSMSAEVGTIRGLHFQLQPRAQGKLVSCIAGALLDVVVDIRLGSPNYGKYISAKLTPESAQQLWVPAGFAHGFCTLEPNTVISYKVTDYYSAEHDRGLAWNDPTVGIEWPVSAEDAHLSAKDQNQPELVELRAGFLYATP